METKKPELPEYIAAAAFSHSGMKSHLADNHPEKDVAHLPEGELFLFHERMHLVAEADHTHRGAK